MRRRFRFVANASEATRIGDIYRGDDGQAYIITAGGPKPATMAPDPSDRGLPGPPGSTGERGRDGVDGKDGAPAPLIIPAGTWRAGKVYPPLSIVTHDGSSYLATAEVKREPPSKGWQLLAAKGEAGKRTEYYTTRNVLPAPLAAGTAVSATFDSNTSKGEVVYISGDGRVNLAQADTEPRAYAIGIATQDVAAGHPGEYLINGPVTCETWALTPGAVYYLDPSTPGGMTTVYPEDTGTFVVILGTAATPTQLHLNIHYMLENG